MKKVLSLILIFSLFACTPRQEQGQKYEETMLAMGTLVTITLYADNEKRANKLFHDLLTDFKYMQVAWHPSKKGSLGRANGLIKYGEPFSTGPAIKDLVLLGTRLSEQSEGYFNPAIGKLIQLWGFSQDKEMKGPPPDQKKIQVLLDSNPRMQDISFNGLTMSTSNPAVMLDFGAFAKGYAVDKSIEYLKSMGVKNAIINAGGDLRAIGTKAGRPWKIGIRDPRASGKQAVIAGVEVQGDESVFTSGDYERYYEYKGKRYHHIINPKTGYPADKVRSVTILHSSAAIADAAATALFVAGPDNWERIAKRMGVDKVMLIDNQGIIHLTPAMKERLSFTESNLNIQVSKAF
ncbi:MAG: FAD:protein FMN transferase [Gammaproteobacteria bacterium]|nr:FAD:protein FMN transferase [Gammaproteobacteria bacterium]